MNFLKGLFLVFVLFSVLSCSENPIDIDVENTNLGIHYVNLDSVYVHTEENQLLANIQKLPLKPNEILDYQLGVCLRVGRLTDTGTVKRIKLFVNDPFIKRVENRIAERFEFTKISSKINEGFSYLKHHFPNGKIPKNVVYMNSLFSSNVFCTENELGIGLERYLGPKTDVIKELPPQDFFEWVKEGMSPAYLERDVLTAWIMTHYVPESKQNTADAMIRWGKIIYLTEAAFPHQEKNIIIRYSKTDYQWALENEYAFWKYLVDEKLLFSDSERDQANFLNEAPFTVGLPEKGPDRLGQFLGWQMVRNYMEQFPETRLDELVKLPYTKILQEYEIAE